MKILESTQTRVAPKKPWPQGYAIQCPECGSKYVLETEKDYISAFSTSHGEQVALHCPICGKRIDVERGGESDKGRFVQKEWGATLMLPVSKN